MSLRDEIAEIVRNSMQSQAEAIKQRPEVERLAFAIEAAEVALLEGLKFLADRIEVLEQRD